MRRQLFYGVAAAALAVTACGKDSAGPPAVTTPTQLSVAVQPSATAQNAAAIAQQPQIRLRDAAGRLTAEAGIVVTASVTGGAVLSSAIATTNASGTAVFSGLSLTSAVGTYTIHFTAGTLTAVDASALVLTPGVPTQLSVTTAPSTTAQAGTPFAAQPAIQLKDVSGNLVAQSGVNVVAGIVSGTPVISNGAALTNSAGLAVFSGLTLSGNTGNYTLRFTSGTLTPALAAAATALAAGAPTQLSVSVQPSTTVSNGTLLPTQPVVQIKDAFGNNAGAAGAIVVATVVSGPNGSTLAGDTAITDATGKATFSGLGITGLVGNYTIRFASGVLSSVVSSATALTPGAATRFSIATQPSTTVQNAAALATQPVIQLVDQSANPVAQPSIVVTASVPNAGVSNATATTDATGKATFAGLAITGLIGNYRVHFSVPLLPADSANVTALSAGPAAGLKIQTAPATAAVNGVSPATQPAVRLVDVSGNNVSQAGVVISATVVSGSVTIANAAATTVATGIATFSGLAITGLVGSYTWRFTATGLTQIDAAAPTAISAGGATQIGLSAQPPAAGQSGIALAPPAVVQLLDISGNAVSQSGVTVTASVIGGGASVAGA
ncbi:MAG TPA: hypothetical protein VGI92_07755, partial [Gemmatimonadales bacterium]